MNSMLGLAVGICGAMFIGYCIYFDNKRRSDPNFKQKLRERRKAAKEEAESRIPPLKDTEALQKYFLQEIQVGEELLSQGNFVSGIEHLANAITVCGQPQKLLSVLNTTLPPQLFQMLLQQLECMKTPGGGQPILTLAEEDVE